MNAHFLFQIKARPKLLKGDAAEALVHYAEQEKFDMVIVGCRGLGFLKR